MKSSLRIPCFLLALGFAVAAPLIHAEDKPLGPPRGERGGKSLRETVEHRDKVLAEKLKLTEEQKNKLDEIRKDQAEQMKAAQEDRAETMREIMKAGRERIRALLTPDQQKEFDAMPHHGPGRRRGE